MQHFSGPPQVGFLRQAGAAGKDIRGMMRHVTLRAFSFGLHRLDIHWEGNMGHLTVA
jgi:hypothetical protein